MPSNISEFVAVVVAGARDGGIGAAGAGAGRCGPHSGCLPPHPCSQVPRGVSDVSPAALTSPPSSEHAVVQHSGKWPGM